MTDFTGTAGVDTFTGGAGADNFFMQQGGDDVVAGLGGNDGFYFGAALTGNDDVDGGLGTDSLALQGNYAGLALGDVVAVEVLIALAGNDTRFGDLAGNFYDYDITTADANVAAGATLTLIAANLRPGEDIVFDGSAETNGNFRIFAGQGLDDHTGGSGNDGFFFGSDGNLTGADRVVGGGGADTIALRGNYVGARAVTFQAASFTGIEAITFLSGWTNEFGGFIDTNGFDYSVTMADGNVGAGIRLDVIAGNLRANETLTFNGAAEIDGSYRVISGAGNDSIIGSAGDDLLFGRDGADTMSSGDGDDLLDGGAGNDVLDFGASLTAADTAVGGADQDALLIGGRTYNDVDFTGASGLETLVVQNTGSDYFLGAEAAAAGFIRIVDSSGGANRFDLAAFSRPGDLFITLGVGADTIILADVGSNQLVYNKIADSSGAAVDTVFGFTSGADRVIATTFDTPAPLTAIEWQGNQAGLVAAQAALQAGDGNMDAVFDTVTRTLWFNVNDDGVLDANDLAILMPLTPSLAGPDVLDGQSIINI